MPPNPFSHPCAYKALAAGLLGAALTAGAFWVADNAWAHRLEDRARSRVLQELTTYRARLEGELSATVHLTLVLSTYAGIHPDLDQAEFEHIAAALHARRPDVIRNITLAPDNVIRYVYPREGNEAVLGMDLYHHPEQGDSVRRMMAEGRTVLAGPWPLREGGEGLLIRTPVYLEGPDGRRYWGLSSIPVNLEAIQGRARLGDVQRRLEIALRGRDGLGAQGAVFYGDPALFHGNTVRQAVAVTGGRWEMAARPRQGWAAWTGRPGAWYLAGGVLVLMAGLLSWNLTYQALRLRESERRYRAQGERLRAIIRAMPDIFFILDAQGRYLEIFGGTDEAGYHQDYDGLVGLSVKDVLPVDKARLFLDHIRQVLATGQLQTLEYALAAADVGLDESNGPVGPQWFEGRATPLDAQVMGRPAVLWLAVNITQRKKAQEDMRHMALHDPLTGLANRSLLRDRVEHALAQARRSGHGVALMFIDLDDFKPVNDRLGHDAGDRMLCEVAHRLMGAVRASDTVARVGGDEFVVLLEDLEHRDRVREVATKILEILGRPVEIKGRVLRIGCSIGIGLYPQDGDGYEALMGSADQALYCAKHRGKARFWPAGPASDPDERTPDPAGA
ncbi:diguanylate cyclase domain-containing protein [Ectothiorhodospira mobilis]|uniref:sensor domain-containing diguanylate cyclase n=1 Tax=Ectothiorhodospira mobilis TaxID=195064 RepID=UPI001EE9A427|nr:diguanylate cyclase [Ectothiorhodospira mobilis]MCG5536122.1 diguanylate cyclase [Ectothiorhodospira mobilis]